MGAWCEIPFIPIIASEIDEIEVLFSYPNPCTGQDPTFLPNETNQKGIVLLSVDVFNSFGPGWSVGSL